MDLSGETIGPGGRYRVDRLLGEGGAGAVYFAYDTTFSRPCAVKALAPHHAANTKIRDRFMTEGMIQANLLHPNIVRALDAIQDDSRGLLAIVLDYVEGPDLAEHSHSIGPMPLRDAVGLILPILDAVQYAHDHDVVHRDLKPGNVLIDTTGAAAVPKVTDFGVAKLVGESSVAARAKTRVGAVIGTPDYMSPEQLKGAADIDGRADVYAVGAIFFQLLTATVPYGEGSEYEIVAKVLGRGALPSACAVRPELPRQVDELIATAMAFEREHRFVSCAAMAAALRSLAADLAAPLDARATDVDSSAQELAHHDSDWSEPAPARRKLTPGLLGAIACGALLLGAAGVWMVAGGDERAAADPSVDRDPGTAKSVTLAVATPKAAPAPEPLRFHPDLWKVGNRWVYLHTRSPKPGVLDESAHLSYFEVRRVVSNTAHPQGRLLHLITEGGIYGPRTRELVVSDRCFIHSKDGTELWCLQGTVDDTKAITAGGREYATTPVIDLATRARFSALAGVVFEEVTDKRGRNIKRELVAWRLGDRTFGEHDAQPPTCDWTAKSFRGKRKDYPGYGALFGRCDVSSERYRVHSVPVARGAGMQVYGETTFDDTAPYHAWLQGLHESDGDGYGYYLPSRLLWLKHWWPVDGSASYVAALFENEIAVNAVIFRATDEGLTFTDFSFVRLQDPRTAFAIYLVATQTGCALELRRQMGIKPALEIRVARFQHTAGGLQRVAGSLGGTLQPVPASRTPRPELIRREKGDCGIHH